MEARIPALLNVNPFIKVWTINVPRTEDLLIRGMGSPQPPSKNAAFTSGNYFCRPWSPGGLLIRRHHNSARGKHFN
ncbi:hypothetical protein CEXT_784271 [Caerostris extrusa]|uniref:Uncharacterized protein n=1 Tax=Caerostris extrusa TaxID=172846 RepID=A0AAV4MLD3_CAEEX|nr:hypothetical protein CEXT_784271 [Caerostris extrusa]